MRSFDIPLEVVDTNSRRMAEAVMHELATRLRALVEREEPHSIDLRSLPLDPAAKDWLREQLGQGEVEANLDSIGSSKVYETGFSGIWWVSHSDPEERVVAEFIEVCWIPDILQSQREDVKHSLHTLENSINVAERGDEL